MLRLPKFANVACLKLLSSELSEKKQEYIAIGRIGAPWGLKGEAKFQLYNPESEVLKKTRLIYFKAGFCFQEYRLRGFRKQGDSFLLGLESYSSPEEIKKLQGEEVFVDCKFLPPKKNNEYFVHELVGMTAVDEEGTEWGKVLALENYGSSDLLNIRKEVGDILKDYLIPWIRDLILSVDEKAKKIVIRKMEGLLD